jgi:hypothetical protein
MIIYLTLMIKYGIIYLLKIKIMHQKIKNWHLSILIGVVSIVSIALIDQYALAQWNNPIGLPGETPGFRLVVNPLAENLSLNGYDILDANLRIDGNGPHAIQVDNGSAICLDGTTNCITSWSDITASSFWNQNVNKIYYNSGEVGIGTNDPNSALEIFSDVAGDSDLKLRNSAGDINLIFQEYETPATGDFSITYNGDNPTINNGYSNWLEFWGRDHSGRPIMTMQRDYSTTPPIDVYQGVGIGVPSEDFIDAKLRVQNSGTEDILQLYDDNTLVFQVSNGGSVGIDGPVHGVVPLFINGSGSNGLKIYPNKLYSYLDDLELYATDQVYTYNYFGIGTDAPNSSLHIYRSNDNAEMDIQSGSNTHWGIYQSNGTGDLRFWNTDNRITFTDEGELGIGTINPNAYLHVDKGPGQNYAAFFNGNVALEHTSGGPYNYLQIDHLSSGATPPVTDCDEPEENGRMIYDYTNNELHICDDSGWVSSIFN